MKTLKLANGDRVWIEYLAHVNEWCVYRSPVYGSLELFASYNTQAEAHDAVNTMAARSRAIERKVTRRINKALPRSPESRLD